MTNAYFYAALLGLLLVEAVDLAGELLNLKALRLEAPAELADVYDPEGYRRSQEYTRVRTRFGLVVAGFDLVVLLLFWLLGGFGWLDGVVRGWELGPIWGGLVFLLVLMLGRGVLDLPFSAWGTFVIEEEFGFNRTSRGTFVLDRLKGLAVALVLGVPLLVAFLALFEYGGSWAWVYAWIAAAFFSVVMQIIAPTLIMPLFNKFTPVEEGELKEAILAYAHRVSFPLKGVFTIDASRRSTKGNAFFTGFGKSKRIALFDTLVQRHPTDELVTVLAHEVGHYKKRHVPLGTVLSILEMGVFLALFALLVDELGLFAAFGVDTPSTYAGVVFVSILLRPLQLVLSIAGAALSRRHERQADRFAADTTGRGDLLASGLKRLSRDSLSNLTPHPFYVFLNYSHPPLLERTRALSVGDTVR
jgi:STE24 endopeptidase